MNKRKITKKRYNWILNLFIIQKRLYKREFEKKLGMKCPFIYTRDGRRI